MQFTKILVSAIAAFSAVASATSVPQASKRDLVAVSSGDETIIFTPAVTVNGSSIVEARQAVTAALTVAKIVLAVYQIVSTLAADDIARRQLFTREVVGSVSQQFPTMSTIMCNVGYSLTCTPYLKYSTKYDAMVGNDVTYDILVIGPGCTFTRQGDGGFQNWAARTQTTCTVNGAVIRC